MAEGLQARAGQGNGEGKAAAEAVEPLAEWEQELLAGATTSAPDAEAGAETTTDAS
nr:30S ribosomal protein S2 [Mycolicibacter nonchromogenicus]